MNICIHVHVNSCGDKERSLDPVNLCVSEPPAPYGC